MSSLDLRAEGEATRIAQALGLPSVVAQLLAARGVDAPGAAGFLKPTIRDLLPDPSRLTDMDAAASRLADAIERRERVAVFGDYDVDGAASSAMLKRYLRHFGLEAAVRIPDRISEGYGPNVPAMIELVEDGATLIVTVDCGTTSFESVAAARGRRADILVLDHHQTVDALPEANAIVNPNRRDDASGLGHLCAAGIVFMTIVATQRELRRRGRDADSLPDLMRLLDLVALATICDVVPLVGLNRAFVVRGLQTMGEAGNAGIAALARAARLHGTFDAYHLGFILGPRINAGGRIGEADLGSRLLALDDPIEAFSIAERLDGLNAERQAMERAMLARAEAEVEADLASKAPPAVILTASEHYHPGIVGLIAARLKERHRRPAIAVAVDGLGKGTGSARSIDGFDMGRAIRGAVEAGILEKGGGHAMAAGLTVRRERLGNLRAFLEERGGETVSALVSGEILRIDGALSAAGLNADLVHTIERAGPFGAGHPAPLFALASHRIGSSAAISGGHVRATLRAQDGSTVQAIAFRAAETPMGERLLKDRDRPIHVAGALSIDTWQGRREVRFRIVDAANA